MKYTEGLKSRLDHLGSVNCSEKKETEVVWSHDKVKQTIQDSPTRNHTGRKMYRGTTETVGGQHRRMDEFDICQVTNNYTRPLSRPVGSRGLFRMMYPTELAC